MNSSFTFSDLFGPEEILFYRTNPCAFIEDVIFGKNSEYKISPHQKQLIEAVRDYKRVSAKSGKGCGKTSGISWIILWFITVFENPKIIVTAPTAPQIKTALWTELSLWLNRSLLRYIFEKTTEKLFLKESKATWYCEARTARDKESMQGIHAENLLILIDEASGLSEEIFETLDTTLTGKNNKIVMIGNPTQVTGPFYDAFHKFSKRWHTYTFNAEDAPYPLRNDEQIEYYSEKYGKTHNLYRVNILGEFPTGNVDSFISLSDVLSAAERDVIPGDDIQIGVDVARFGDDLTVLYWRRGNHVYSPKILSKSSIDKVVDLVISTVIEIRGQVKYKGKIKVYVDSVGVGAGVCDYLKKDRDHNLEIVECNGAGKGDELYHNEISKMWGNLRDRINHISIPKDPNLIEELSARRWKFSGTNKIQIEPKKEFKKEFGSSPDRADALILCFAEKKSDRIVLKEFDSLSNIYIKDCIAFKGNENYCGVFYTKEMDYFIIYGSWDGFKLSIYDEFYGENDIPSCAINIKHHGDFRKIIGSKLMFGTSMKDVASKFYEYKVNVNESYNYDEMGSIEALSTLIKQQRFNIGKNCNETINQLSNWRMDTNKLDQGRNFGFCYAICHIIGELKKNIETFGNFTYTNNFGSNIHISKNLNQVKSIHWMIF